MGWRLLIAPHGTNMSNLGHQGRGRFPSSKITIFSRMWQLMKCIRRLILLADHPRKPSTGHDITVSIHGKKTWQIRDYSGEGVGGGGGPLGTPRLCRPNSGSAPPVNLRQGPKCIMDSRNLVSDRPIMFVPPLSSVGHTPPLSDPQ